MSPLFPLLHKPITHLIKDHAEINYVNVDSVTANSLPLYRKRLLKVHQKYFYVQSRLRLMKEKKIQSRESTTKKYIDLIVMNDFEK